MKIFIFIIFTFWLVVSSYSQNKSMAVTIDDLPLVRGARDSASYINITSELLNHLNLFNIPAVGFVNEEKLYNEGKIQQYRIDALNLWLKSGLEIGNHTFSHPSLNNTQLQEFLEDLKKGETVSKQISLGNKMPYRYFRHPFLHTGRSIQIRDSLNIYLKENGYIVAPVTIDNSEWIFALAYDNALKNNDTASTKLIISHYIPYMIEKISYWEQQSEALFGHNIKQILLIHANRLNADAGTLLFNAIKNKGYKFITLEETLTDPVYLSEDKFTGAGGISWIHRWAITKGVNKDFFKGENLVPGEILKLAGVESE